MSDLLTRSHTAQFNFDRLLRADIETRFEAYKVGIEAGFLTPDEARQREGLEPGSSEYAPVPFAAPQAIPTLLPPNREIVATRSSLADVFCPKCGKIVGRAAGAAEIMCRRCRVIVTQDAVVEVQARTALDVLHDAVTREPPPAPNVNVTSPPQSVTFEAGAIQVAAPDMAPMTELAASISEMANRPAPANEITVHPSEVHIDEGAIRVEMPPVEIQPPAINVEAPNVTVNVPEQRPMRREVKRDKANNIISIEEVPA
jgi:phage FluMu protein Com